MDSIFETTNNHGMTVSAEYKLNYYKTIIMKKLIGGKGLTEDNKPKNLKEAVAIIIDATPDEIIDKIESGEYKPTQAHFGLGMWIRNNWGLHTGGKLQDWFHEKGIRHPDDMSRMILETIKREICDEDWDVEGQVQFYRDYWKGLGEDPDQICRDDG